MSTNPGPVPPPRLSVRRPPAPAGPLATVTRLSPGADQRDDVPLASVQGALALDLGRRGMATPHLEPGPDLGPGAGSGPTLSVVDDPARQEHELKAWAARFVQTTVEVLGGDRPVSQLLRWTSARVYQDLERRARILGRVTGGPGRPRTVRPQVRSVHVFRPGPDSAEVSVHVRHGARSRAVAARLERSEAGWRCVALQLG